MRSPFSARPATICRRGFLQLICACKPQPVLQVSRRPCASKLIFASLKKPFHFLFALLFCLQLVGGPYALLQVYAWGTMITAYSKESGILQGTKDTFSGEKPCHLCCKITEAKKADVEKKQEAPTPTAPTKLSLEFLASRNEFLVHPIAESLPPVTFFGHLFQDRTSTRSPSIPPPKQRA